MFKVLRGHYGKLWNCPLYSWETRRWLASHRRHNIRVWESLRSCCEVQFSISFHFLNGIQVEGPWGRALVGSRNTLGHRSIKFIGDWWLGGGNFICYINKLLCSFEKRPCLLQSKLCSGIGAFWKVTWFL